MAHVLLVEDDDTTARLVQFLVERQGHTLQWARDGREGLACLEQQRPDVLILDWLLPYVDGLEVLQQVRRHTVLAGLPVLVLTGKSREEDVVRVLDAGADDYLSKPFQPGEFTARLARLLRSR